MHLNASRKSHKVAVGTPAIRGNTRWAPRVSIAFQPEMLAEIARRAAASNRPFAAVVRELLESALGPQQAA
jgi:hypothetical protein